MTAVMTSPHACAKLVMCKSSATGTRTRVARVRAEYPNQLDYSGIYIHIKLVGYGEKLHGCHLPMSCVKAGSKA